MAVSKAELEKAMKMVPGTMSDELYTKLTTLAAGPSTMDDAEAFALRTEAWDREQAEKVRRAEYERAMKAKQAATPSAPRTAAGDDTARPTASGPNANSNEAPMLADAKKAAKGAKPIVPPVGTGTVSFPVETRQGPGVIKENITSPADIDRLVASGAISADEGASYKASKWGAPPMQLVADMSKAPAVDAHGNFAGDDGVGWDPFGKRRPVMPSAGLTALDQSLPKKGKK